MAKGFGQLAKVYGIISYQLSPHEQKALKGWWSLNTGRFIRYVQWHAIPMGIPFSLGYLTYTWAENDFKQRQRKNPADFVNDV